MHIAFVDITRWDYNIDTPYCVPLGGSQSALCYLAEELAKLGHDVRLLNRSSQVAVSRGVTCAPVLRVSAAAWKEFDVVIVQNWAEIAVDLRSLLRSDAKLILWTQHADNQPAMHLLADPAFRDAHDAYAFVSDWQRERFEQVYHVEPGKSHVIRNAISPAFEDRFVSDKDILSQKRRPPVLAYTSTPFRGLDMLIAVFPRIREAVPGTMLRVYSSMKVYHLAADSDAAQYGQLYEQCRSTPGVEYVGSLPQPELASELAGVSILSYPNHFAETSCIAAMEAMASGCHVVTSSLGALPETTAGFGTLVPVDGDWRGYPHRFIEATIDVLRRLSDPSAEETIRLARQVAFMNECCTWRVRAREWQAWLEAL
jgi:glycosyltransferase involved in cell wall biosynthesis